MGVVGRWAFWLRWEGIRREREEKALNLKTQSWREEKCC